MVRSREIKKEAKQGLAVGEKKKSELADLISQVEKTHGKNIVVPGTNALVSWRYLPTGITILDLALLGGIPESSITSIYGWAASGKTTIAMRAAAAAQRKYPDKAVVWVDYEGTYDKEWAERNGVVHDEEKFIYVMPEYAEQGVDITHAMLEAKEVSLVVKDSLAAMVPSKINEASAEDNHMAIQARLINGFMAKANLRVAEERKRGHVVSLICINQFRTKMVLMGDNRTLPGGTGQNFYYATKIEVKKRKDVSGKDSRGMDTIDHTEHSFLVSKSKTGMAFNTGDFDIVASDEHRLPKGYIDDLATVITMAKKMGIISGEGGQKKTINGIDLEFSKFSDIEEWMLADRKNYYHLRSMLIMSERERKGLNSLGRDGYLC